MAIYNLREKIQNIIHLPALPTIAMEVIGIIENPKTNVHTLSNIISKDQVLAAKILKIANSPFYGYSKTISTLDFAIVILGFETLKEAVLSVSLISHLSKNVSKEFDINAFWGHSIATSVISRELAKNLGYKILAESFVAGLVHDLGILILNQYFIKEFDEVIQLSKSNNIPLPEAEMKILGVTHDEIGSWLAQRWNFPKQLIESMRYHHNPTHAVINKQLSAIVHFAEFLAHKVDSCEFTLEKGINFKVNALPMLNYSDASYLDTFFEVYRTTIDEEIMKIKNFISQ